MVRNHELTMDEAVAKYRSFWQLQTLTRKDGRRLCYCCNSPDVVGRASMNIWGTIVDFDVCQEHAELDGRRADSVPKPADAEKGERE
jgi:hypothetical protein